MTLESASQVAGIVAAIAAVLGLIWASARFLIKKQSQSQTVSGHGIAVQSGRDTKVSLLHDQTISGRN